MSTKKEQVQPRGFIAEWAVTFILLLFGTTALAQAFVIPSGSMEETLLVGDHLLVDKLAYAPSDSVSSHLLPYSDVHRGDIIVFRYPLDIRQNFVKRAIGIPGDHIHLEDRKLYLNGHLVDEPYTAYTRPPSHYADNFPRSPIEFGVYPRGEQMLRDNVKDGELVVPPGYIFAMGDNRDNSSDSRFWGLVPRENIIGKPLIIYWSYDATTEDLTDPGIGVSHLIDMVIHFPTKTRWTRTFRLIRPHPIS